MLVELQFANGWTSVKNVIKTEVIATLWQVIY